MGLFEFLTGKEVIDKALKSNNPMQIIFNLNKQTYNSKAIRKMFGEKKWITN